MNILDLLKEDGLHPRKVATTKGGEWKSPCPGCHDHGEDRFCSWPAQGEGGTWWCRGCGKRGDLIQYLVEFRKMTYPEACAYLGVVPRARNYSMLSSPGSTPGSAVRAWKPVPISPPSLPWQSQAKTFVFKSRDKLLKSPESLSFLESRSLKLDTISRAFLGFNPDDLYLDRAKWGLPEEQNEKGVPKRLWLPRGIVIPCYRNGQLVRIRIRRMDEDVERDWRKNPDREPIRYCIIPGSDAHACMVLKESPIFVVVESELDAILMDQEAGDLATALALGSAQNRPDAAACTALKKAQCILLALDADSAGANEAWNWWTTNFPNTSRLVPVGGKDPGEMMQHGVSLREWIEVGMEAAGIEPQVSVEGIGANEPALTLVPQDKPMEDILDAFKGAKRIAVNLVATGDDPFLDHQISMIYLAAENGPAFGIDFSKLPDSALAPLRRLFESEISKVFFHAKPQLQFLWRAGFKVEGKISDLMLAEQLLTAGLAEAPPTLEEVTRKYMGQSPSDESSKIQYLIYLVPCIGNEIGKHGLQEIAKLEFACLPVTARMEMNGMRLDVEKWEALKAKLEKAILDDPTKAVSISRSITSMENARKAIHPVTGRIHAHFEQIGTDTGRFSCSNPNLQGIPKDPEIRACFVADPGKVLIRADYSQIELRILAEMSGDEIMIQAFKDGKDFHRLTASKVSGVPFDQVTPDQRQAAKAINFGVVYGMGPDSLAETAWKKYGVKMTREEARLYMDRFFDAFPDVKKRDRTIRNSSARETKTLCGRKRFWSQSDDPTPQQLLNTPIQGTAADIMKAALVRVSTALEGTGGLIIGCIHDEIVVEADGVEKEAVSEILERGMQAAAKGILRRVLVGLEMNLSCPDELGWTYFFCGFVDPLDLAILFVAYPVIPIMNLTKP